MQLVFIGARAPAAISYEPSKVLPPEGPRTPNIVEIEPNVAGRRRMSMSFTKRRESCDEGEPHSRCQTPTSRAGVDADFNELDPKIVHAPP